MHGRTHELDATTVDVIATRLEARSDSGRYMDMLRGYPGAIDLTAARNVLALGCGTGVEVRELLRQSSFAGKVTAVDISPTLIEVGKRIADETEAFIARQLHASEQGTFFGGYNFSVMIAEKAG